MSSSTSPAAKQPNYLYETLNFLSGGAAGILGWLFVHPLDVAKVRLQLIGETGEKKPSMVGMMRNIVAKDGPSGLYAGLSPAILRMATYTTLRQGMYGVYKDYAQQRVGAGQKLSMPTMMACGLMAGATASITTVPVDVCLVRMQADGRLPVEQRRGYTNVFNALSRIAREEGILTYWRGATPTVYRAMVINMAQLSSYDQAKSLYQSAGISGIPLHFASSLTAGFICSAVSLPLDIAKTRMQNQKSVPGQPLQYRSMLHTVSQIMAKEGVLSLWAGFIPYFLRTGGHTITMFLFMEQIKGLIQQFK